MRRTCPYCEGGGQVIFIFGNQDFEQSAQTCPVCGGDAEVYCSDKALAYLISNADDSASNSYGYNVPFSKRAQAIAAAEEAEEAQARAEAIAQFEREEKEEIFENFTDDSFSRKRQKSIKLWAFCA